MKVIKDNSKKRIICPSCDSILEYDHKDVKNINGVKNIHCPVCDTDIQIPRKKKKSKDKSKKSKDNNCNDPKYVNVNLEHLRKNINYVQQGGQKFPSTLKSSCPYCGDDLHRLLITDCHIYECFNCGYKVDFSKGKKVDLGKGLPCKWL